MERVAVVQSIVQLVAETDRQFLERVLVETVCQLIPGIGARLVCVDPPEDGGAVTLLARAGERPDFEVSDETCQTLAQDIRETDSGLACWMVPRRRGIPVAAIALPLVDEATSTVLLLSGHRLGESNQKVALGVATIFCNYVNALGASRTDGLTRLLNRKTFDEKLGVVIAEADARHADPDNNRRRQRVDETWLAIADIDHFKRVNDAYGHVFGDEVLLMFAQIMRATFRREDLLFRYGGEEFAVVLPRTDRAGAEIVLERFREAIAAARIPQVGTVTCSIGYTQVGPGEVPTALFGRADQALYFAKKHGRNQVRFFEDLAAEGHIPHLRRLATAEAELF